MNAWAKITQGGADDCWPCLEERATWNLNGTQQVVACGASVYKQTKKVLEDV